MGDLGYIVGYAIYFAFLIGVIIGILSQKAIKWIDEIEKQEETTTIKERANETDN